MAVLLWKITDSAFRRAVPLKREEGFAGSREKKEIKVFQWLI
jgi:hypothetical protein